MDNLDPSTYVTPPEAAEIAGVSKQALNLKMRTDPQWIKEVRTFGPTNGKATRFRLIPRVLAERYARDKRKVAHVTA
jgi:hypothetical protein